MMTTELTTRLRADQPAPVLMILPRASYPTAPCPLCGLSSLCLGVSFSARSFPPFFLRAYRVLPPLGSSLRPCTDGNLSGQARQGAKFISVVGSLERSAERRFR